MSNNRNELWRLDCELIQLWQLELDTRSMYKMACVHVCTVHFNNLQFMLVSSAYNIKCTLYAIKRLAHTHIRCSTQIRKHWQPNFKSNQNEIYWATAMPLSAIHAHSAQQWNSFIQLSMYVCSYTRIQQLKMTKVKIHLCRCSNTAVEQQCIIME